MFIMQFSADERKILETPYKDLTSADTRGVLRDVVTPQEVSEKKHSVKNYDFSLRFKQKKQCTIASLFKTITLHQ